MAQDQQMPNINAPFVGRDGVINSAWRRFLETLWNRTGSAVGPTDTTITPGSIFIWPGGSAPNGYYLLDGGSKSVAVDPDLFALFGYTYGGAGASFNLPDCRGRMILGVNGSHALGTAGGAEDFTLDVANLPVHQHPITDPGHIHTITDPTHSHGGVADILALNATGVAKDGVVAGSTDAAATGITIDVATTGITGTGDAGSGTPKTHLPPYLALNYIIKR